MVNEIRADSKWSQSGERTTKCQREKYRSSKQQRNRQNLTYDE